MALASHSHLRHTQSWEAKNLSMFANKKNRLHLKSIFLLVVYLLTSSMAHANSVSPSQNDPATDLGFDRVSKIAFDVLGRKYSNLQSYRIVIKPLKSVDTFFQASFDYSHIVKKPHERTYYLEINPVIFKSYPGDEAVAAIITHELSHIQDYTTMTGKKLFAFGKKYLMNKKFVKKYERSTDQIALYKGYGRGLIQYRRWLYEQLKAQQIDLALKKINYYTPEQIVEFGKIHSNEIENFNELSKVPRFNKKL
jgi:hypothetical protein